MLKHMHLYREWRNFWVTSKTPRMQCITLWRALELDPQHRCLPTKCSTFPAFDHHSHSVFDFWSQNTRRERFFGI